MKTIILQNTPNGIMASIYRNGKPDPEMMRLFGTHRVPTAWTGDTAEDVARKVADLNPGAIVDWI